jgi:hypothetical protein
MEHAKGLPAVIHDCFSSTPANEWLEIDSKACNICGCKKNESKLLLCDGCDEQFHMYSLTHSLAH